MSPLRQKLIRDLTLRGFSHHTIRSYVLQVKCLAKYYRRSPDKITSEEIQDYLFYLINEKGLAWSSCSVAAHAFRFFYPNTLRIMNVDFIIPAPKRPKKLNRHYHLHCIIPGGALSADGKKWISTKRPDFLFPVHALSKTFRRLFWHGSKLLKNEDRTSSRFPLKRRVVGLADRLKKRDLTFPSNSNLSLPAQLQSLEDQLYRKRWVVYAKRPFGGPAQVLKYLGRYTHRVAISNYRILSHAKAMVTFTWKDRKNGNQTRTLTLSERAFAVRFLQHVLPGGFKKMRSYGFLSGTKKKKSLILCQKILGKIAIAIPDDVLDSSGDDLEKPEEISYKRRCPKCHKTELIQVSEYSKQEVSHFQISIWNTG
jgi:hypothetical protein